MVELTLNEHTDQVLTTYTKKNRVHSWSDNLHIEESSALMVRQLTQRRIECTHGQTTYTKKNRVYSWSDYLHKEESSALMVRLLTQRRIECTHGQTT